MRWALGAAEEEEDAARVRLRDRVLVAGMEYCLKLFILLLLVGLMREGKRWTF